MSEPMLYVCVASDTAATYGLHPAQTIARPNRITARMADLLVIKTMSDWRPAQGRIITRPYTSGPPQEFDREGLFLDRLVVAPSQPIGTGVVRQRVRGARIIGVAQLDEYG